MSLAPCHGISVMQMSVLECRFSGLGICVLAPTPTPMSGGFLRQSLPHEAKGAGRNLPELTPRSTVSWGGFLRWEFCLFWSSWRISFLLDGLKYLRKVLSLAHAYLWHFEHENLPQTKHPWLSLGAHRPHAPWCSSKVAGVPISQVNNCFPPIFALPLLA